MPDANDTSAGSAAGDNNLTDWLTKLCGRYCFVRSHVSYDSTLAEKDPEWIKANDASGRDAGTEGGSPAEEAPDWLARRDRQHLRFLQRQRRLGLARGYFALVEIAVAYADERCCSNPDPSEALLEKHRFAAYKLMALHIVDGSWFAKDGVSQVLYLDPYGPMQRLTAELLWWYLKTHHERDVWTQVMAQCFVPPRLARECMEALGLDAQIRALWPKGMTDHSPVALPADQPATDPLPPPLPANRLTAEPTPPPAGAPADTATPRALVTAKPTQLKPVPFPRLRRWWLDKYLPRHTDPDRRPNAAMQRAAAAKAFPKHRPPDERTMQRLRADPATPKEWRESGRRPGLRGNRSRKSE